MGICLANLNSKQSVVHPTLWLIHVGFSRYDVVVARKYHRRSGEKQFSGMGQEPIKPTQLVFEFRSRCGIAVRQVEAADYDAGHCRLDVSTVDVIRVAGKNPSYFLRLGVLGKDRDAIPAFLPVPNDTV